MILRAAKLACERPRGVVGLAYLFGYCRAAVRRTDRVRDPEYRRFTHRELRRRLLGYATRRPAESLAARETAFLGT